MLLNDRGYLRRLITDYAVARHTRRTVRRLQT